LQFFFHVPWSFLFPTQILLPRISSGTLFHVSYGPNFLRLAFSNRLFFPLSLCKRCFFLQSRPSALSHLSFLASPLYRLTGRWPSLRFTVGLTPSSFYAPLPLCAPSPVLDAFLLAGSFTLFLMAVMFRASSGFGFTSAGCFLASGCGPSWRSSVFSFFFFEPPCNEVNVCPLFLGFCSRQNGLHRPVSASLNHLCSATMASYSNSSVVLCCRFAASRTVLLMS